MGLRKCPKCELNYIRYDQQLCDVCSRKRRVHNDDGDELLCIECGEHPAMKGKEICSYCYKEALRQEQLVSHRGNAAAIAYGELEIDDVEVPLDDDEIPESEIGEIEDEFGEDDVSDEDFDDDDRMSPDDFDDYGEEETEN